LGGIAGFGCGGSNLILQSLPLTFSHGPPHLTWGLEGIASHTLGDRRKAVSSKHTEVIQLRLVLLVLLRHGTLHLLQLGHDSTPSLVAEIGTKLYFGAALLLLLVLLLVIIATSIHQQLINIKVLLHLVNVKRNLGQR